MRFSTCLLASSLLIAPLAAQNPHALQMAAQLTNGRVHLDFQIQGPPGGFAALMFAPGQLIVPPLPTPWGDLFLNPNTMFGVGVPLDATGRGHIAFTLRPTTPFLMGAQAILVDPALNLQLSNPAAFAGAVGQTLTYSGGKFTASATGARGAQIVVKVKKKSGNRDELAAGAVQNEGEPVNLAGDVPVDPNDPPEFIELYIDGVLVSWVRC